MIRFGKKKNLTTICIGLIFLIFSACKEEAPPPLPEEKPTVVRRIILASEEDDSRDAVRPSSENLSAVAETEGKTSVEAPVVSGEKIPDRVVVLPDPSMVADPEAKKSEKADAGSVDKKAVDEVMLSEGGTPAHPAMASLIMEEESLSGELKVMPHPDQAREGEEAVLTAVIPDAVVYIAEGRLDPFRTLIQEKPEVKREEDRQVERRVPQTPLEKVDLSQLKLVGIIRSPMGPRAMVEESSGRGYVVVVGTYMGLNSGKVTAIEGERLVVTEIVETLSGEIREERRELRLQKPTGE